MSTLLRLRTLINQAFQTLDRSFTWAELDQNFVSLKNLIMLSGAPNTVGVTQVADYSPHITYRPGVPPMWVKFDGRLWRNIATAPHSGRTPSTNPLNWELSYPGAFAHERNGDVQLTQNKISININNPIENVNLASFLNANSFDCVINPSLALDVSLSFTPALGMSRFFSVSGSANVLGAGVRMENTATQQIGRAGEQIILRTANDFAVFAENLIPGKNVLISSNLVHNRHYRGTFVSLAALIAAIPVANEGDTAIIDAGLGDPAENAVWDVTDNIWVLAADGTYIHPATHPHTMITGLGTAAVANVQVTHEDIIAGRVLTVGAFGLSVQALLRMGGNMNTVVQSGLYYCEVMSNAPATEDIILRVHRAFSTYIIQTAYSTTQPAIWTRAMLAGAWTAWRRVITDGNIATHALDGLMTAADKIKLDGIPVGGGAYVHPDTHPASMIEQSATLQFVTDTEKATWNAKLDANQVVALPAPNLVLRLDAQQRFPSSVIALATLADAGLMSAADKNKLDWVGVVQELTGTLIAFTNTIIYNTAALPGTGNITHDLVGARLGIIQKLYHNAATVPTFPASWVKLTGEYKVNVLNIIYAEWCGGTRVEYWIIS